MINIRRHILLLVAIFIAFSVNAQEFGSNVIKAPVEEKPIIVKKKGFNPDIDVSISLGTSFSSFGPGMNMFGTYVMPELTIPINKKFAIQAGIGYSSIFYSTPGNEGTIFEQNNMQYGSVYVSGIYAVNEKLTIAGTAFKTFEIAPPKNTANPRALDYSNEGIAVNVDYKISDNVRIGVGFSYEKYNPYNYYGRPGGFNNNRNGFGRMNTSPFGNPGFGSGFGTGF